jgi:DNA-binding NarL/FixJ family response regulator
MARKAPRLFSYGRERDAARTLRVLRAKHGPATEFRLVLREDWRFYILATRADGASGYVAKAVLRPRHAAASAPDAS